jgi:hypothetical protein
MTQKMKMISHQNEGMNPKRSFHLAAPELPHHNGPDFRQRKWKKLLIIAAGSNVVGMRVGFN